MGQSGQLSLTTEVENSLDFGWHQQPHSGRQHAETKTERFGAVYDARHGEADLGKPSRLIIDSGWQESAPSSLTALRQRRWLHDLPNEQKLIGYGAGLPAPACDGPSSGGRIVVIGGGAFRHDHLPDAFGTPSR